MSRLSVTSPRTVSLYNGTGGATVISWASPGDIVIVSFSLIFVAGSNALANGGAILSTINSQNTLVDGASEDILAIAPAAFFTGSTAAVASSISGTCNRIVRFGQKVYLGIQVPTGTSAASATFTWVPLN